MEVLFSAAAVSAIPIKKDYPAGQGMHVWIVRGSASQSRELEREPDDDPPSIDPGVQIAAAVESLVNSVRLEIDQDLAGRHEEGTPHPTAICKSLAIKVAREMALRFYKQTWVDIAGFVANDGRIAVLAHSMETGRRATFYVDEAHMQVIQTSVSGDPVWLAATLEEVPSLLNWITRID